MRGRTLERESFDGVSDWANADDGCACCTEDLPLDSAFRFILRGDANLGTACANSPAACIDGAPPATLTLTGRGLYAFVNRFNVRLRTVQSQIDRVRGGASAQSEDRTEAGMELFRLLANGDEGNQ